MTVPKMFQGATQRVSDIVREMVPLFRNRLSTDEADLGIYLRGNTKLFEALKKVIKSRITGRAHVPVPSDPIVCKAMLERDRELQWVLARLDFIYRSPVSRPEQDDREQPA